MSTYADAQVITPLFLQTRSKYVLKIPKKQQQFIGPEYHPDVKDDEDFCKKIR